MAINLPDQETRNQYLANGTQNTFAYTFKAFDAVDLEVYVTLTGNEPNPPTDIKILTTDYTVTDVTNINGGNVIFVAGKLPSANATVTIIRNIPASIISAFSDPTTFNGENLDIQLERLTALIQQNKTSLDFNSLKYAINAILINNTESILPTLENGQIWKKVNGAIIGVIPKDSDTTLRSELASAVVGADGALLVGYNDNGTPKVIKTKLDELTTAISNLPNTEEKSRVVDGYYTVAGTNVLVLTPANPLPLTSSYTLGDKVTFIPINDNTTATTININGIGIVGLQKLSFTGTAIPLIANDLTRNKVMTAIYNGTVFIISEDTQPLLVSMRAAGTQVIPTGTSTIQYPNTVINDGTWFNTGTSEFKPTVKGFYEYSIYTEFTNINPNPSLFTFRVLKNTTAITNTGVVIGTTSYQVPPPFCSSIVQMNGTTDTLRFEVVADTQAVTISANSNFSANLLKRT